jgi:hypothetical protein
MIAPPTDGTVWRCSAIRGENAIPAPALIIGVSEIVLEVEQHSLGYGRT